MASITLNFNNPINVSIQSNAKDIVYFQDMSSNDKEIYKKGECTAIGSTSITCDIADASPRPSSGDFIFFAKDAVINTSGVIGYYGEAEFKIVSNSKVELFAVSSEIFISS